MTSTSGCWRSTSARPSNSSRLYTEPVGLEGLQRMMAFVRGVMAAANCWGVILKFCSIVASTNTGSPSAKRTISG